MMEAQRMENDRFKKAFSNSNPSSANFPGFL